MAPISHITCWKIVNLRCTLFDIDERKLQLRFGNRTYRYCRCDISKDAAKVDEAVRTHDVVYKTGG